MALDMGLGCTSTGFVAAAPSSDFNEQMAQVKSLREAAKKFHEQALSCEYPDVQTKLLDKASAHEAKAAKIVDNM